MSRSSAGDAKGTDEDICPKCSAIVSLFDAECQVCNRQMSFPNVRMAERRSEVEALAGRLKQAEASAKARSADGDLSRFIEEAGKSQAVMNRSLGALNGWVNGQNPLFVSYYKQRSVGRTPDGSAWDEQRAAAESAINPYCYEELSYAALSLDGSGLTKYGPYTVELKELTIEDRASVFEENPFVFNRKHHVVAGTSPPLGYRAPWGRRGELAGAKLQAKITVGIAEAAFPDVLMEARRNESDCDFVEVHIYGPVNRAGLAAVRGPAPKRGPDRVTWQQATRALKALGVLVEETS